MDERVKRLIEKPLNEKNIKLCKVEYVLEGSVYFLRVIIDKEPFVDVDTCVLATEIIDTIEEEFDDAYVLDVCSMEKGEN